MGLLDNDQVGLLDQIIGWNRRRRIRKARANAGVSSQDARIAGGARKLALLEALAIVREYLPDDHDAVVEINDMLDDLDTNRPAALTSNVVYDIPHVRKVEVCDGSWARVAFAQTYGAPNAARVNMIHIEDHGETLRVMINAPVGGTTHGTPSVCHAGPHACGCLPEQR